MGKRSEESILESLKAICSDPKIIIFDGSPCQMMAALTILPAASKRDIGAITTFIVDYFSQSEASEVDTAWITAVVPIHRALLSAILTGFYLGERWALMKEQKKKEEDDGQTQARDN